MMREGQKVAELQVAELSERPDGLRALQATDLEEQIEFALAAPQPLVQLTPRQMQRQMISADVRMIPALPDWPLKRGQRFAVVRVSQTNGRLLAAEILNCSDTPTRELAVRVLKQVTFNNRLLRDRRARFEGAVMLVVPQR